MQRVASRIAHFALKQIFWVGLALAIGLSALAPNGASSDDISVSVDVLDSTPTATPTQFVTLPLGTSASAAPTVTIQLTGLEPYSFVQIFAQSDPVLIASGFADKYGVFKAKANIPSDLAAGDHSITASVQKQGETVATLQTLTKFVVSTSGLLQKPSKNSGGSSGGGAGGNSGSGSGQGSSGGTVTESPVATPQPPQEQPAGVLLVGGVEGFSQSSWNILGEPARVSVSISNNYTKAYAVSADILVTNFLGQEVARISNYKVASLKPKTNIMLIANTKDPIGQWGYYNTSITLSPPQKIDGLELRPIVREGNFFVLPVLPLAVIFALVLFDQLYRNFATRWLRKRMFQQRVVDLDSNEEVV